MISIFKGEIIEDIIRQEPLQVKSVLLSRPVWIAIRPFIKQLQDYGFWYDVAEDNGHIYLRCEVNEITERYINQILEREGA